VFEVVFVLVSLANPMLKSKVYVLFRKFTLTFMGFRHPDENIKRAMIKHSIKSFIKQIKKYKYLLLFNHFLKAWWKKSTLT